MRRDGPSSSKAALTWRAPRPSRPVRGWRASQHSVPHRSRQAAVRSSQNRPGPIRASAVSEQFPVLLCRCLPLASFLEFSMRLNPSAFPCYKRSRLMRKAPERTSKPTGGAHRWVNCGSDWGRGLMKTARSRSRSRSRSVGLGLVYFRYGWFMREGPGK